MNQKSDWIQHRLDQYQCQTSQEEDHAIREITQELVIFGLAEAQFFKQASFLGGTCLRIVHRLRRFSEDLDFALKSPNAAFDWTPFLDQVTEHLARFGYQLEVSDRKKHAGAVAQRWLKEQSIGSIVEFEHHRHPGKSLKIKLELDCHPPAHASHAASFLTFPVDHMITTMDLPTLFAGKSNALLSRHYMKGRDWFDWSWYISQKTSINWGYLQAALAQMGLWEDPAVKLTHDWYMEAMTSHIHKVDWDAAQKDVAPFLREPERSSVRYWSIEFFMEKLHQLSLNQ